MLNIGSSVEDNCSQQRGCIWTTIVRFRVSPSLYLEVIRELCEHFRLKPGKKGTFGNNCRKASRDNYFRQTQLPDARAQFPGYPETVLGFAAVLDHLHEHRGLHGQSWAWAKAKCPSPVMSHKRADALSCSFFQFLPSSSRRDNHSRRRERKPLITFFLAHRRSKDAEGDLLTPSLFA